jgi:hypothetical protein
MFGRVVMDVIKMVLKVPCIPNAMFPKSPLPNTSIPISLLGIGNRNLVPSARKPRFSESILDSFEPRRKVLIALG